jgi:hypothetical protein
MGHDTDRDLAHATRDLLQRLFTQALDLELLGRFQRHAGGVIKVDLLQSSAVFASGHAYPDLVVKLRSGLGDLTDVPTRDMRIQAA